MFGLVLQVGIQIGVQKQIFDKKGQPKPVVSSQPPSSQRPKTPKLDVIKNVRDDDNRQRYKYRPNPIFIPRQTIKKPQFYNELDIKEKIRTQFKRNHSVNKPIFTLPTNNKRTYIVPKFTRKPIISVRNVSIKRTTTVPKTSPNDYTYFLFSKHLTNNTIDVRIEFIVNDTKSIYVDPLHIKYFREYLTFTKYTNTYILRILSPSMFLYRDLLDKNNKIRIKVTIYDNNNKIFENTYIPLSIVSNIVDVNSIDGGNNSNVIFDITMVSELFLKMYKNYTFRKYVGMTPEEILHNLQKSYNYTAKTTNTTITTNNIIYKYSNMNDIDFLKYLSNIAKSESNPTVTSIFDIYHFYVHDNSLLSVNTNYFKNNPIIIDSQYVPYLKTTNYVYNTVPQLNELLVLSYDVEKINLLTNNITNQSDMFDNGHVYRNSFVMFNNNDVPIELEMIKKNRKKFNILQNTMIVVIPINIPNLTVFSYIKVVNDIQIQKLGFQEGIVLGYFADVHNTESLLFTTVLIIHKLK